MRLLSAAVVAAASAGLALAGCDQRNVDLPDGWWRVDAGHQPDGSLPVGDNWIAVDPPAGVTSFKLNAVAAAGTSMLAVGANGAAFSYDSTSLQWSSKQSGTTAGLNALTAVTAARWWIAGDAKTVLEYDGASFTPAVLPATATSPNLTAIAALGSGVWALGAQGARFYFDGAAWADATLPTATADLTGAWSSGQAVWAVDAGGGVHRFSAPGAEETFPLPSFAGRRLHAIWGFGESEIWIVGQGLVQQCAYALLAITCQDRAGGDDGIPWHAVWGDATGLIWIGSKERTLLKWTGTRFEPPAGYSVNGGRDLWGLGGSFQVGIWGVGDNVLQRLKP